MKRIIETIKDLKDILNSNNICDNGSVYLENMDNEIITIGKVGKFTVEEEGYFSPIALFEINNHDNKPKFNNLKEFKNYLNSTTEYDKLQPIIKFKWNNTGKIDKFELTFITVELEIGGEPCVYLVGASEDLKRYFIKDNYSEINKNYWNEESHCFDKNGIWSPSGIYSAEGKTREEEDY